MLEEIFRNLDWENKGLNINGTNLSHLRFADDLVLFAEDSLSLQGMLEQLAVESAKAGLTMNLSKTKAMTNRDQIPLRVRDQEVEYVEEYIYLGQIIAPKLQMDKEIQRRLSNSWSRYWSLKEIMKNQSVPMQAKCKVFNMCILPVLTYGCQTWGLTKSHTQRLKVCQQAMERSMLNIKLMDKWSLSTIRKLTAVSDVMKKVKILKWRWTGHMMRSNKNKWSKEITSWYPRDGKRRRGRPVKRWEDDLVKGWRRLSQDRNQWHNMEEAYVRGGQPE